MRIKRALKEIFDYLKYGRKEEPKKPEKPTEEKASKKPAERSEDLGNLKHYFRVIIIYNSRFIIVLLPIAFILILFFATRFQSITLSRLENDKIKYNDFISEISYEINHNLEQSNEVFIENQIRSVLTSGQILAYADLYWNYTLEVNNEPVSGESMVVEPEGSSLEIVFTQRRTPNPLPPGIINTGSITGGDRGDDIKNHINFFDLDYEEERIENEEETILRYVFEDVNPGQEIRFSISYQLASEIENEFEDITIIIE